jgi:hypothetical protein
MRVSVKLSKQDKNLMDDFMKESFFNNKKMMVRTAIALGLSKMMKGVRKEQKGNERFSFNTKTIDPEDIFEILAYYIISKQMGASISNKKIILAKKEELAELIGEALIIGISELPNFDINKLSYNSDIYPLKR